MAKLALKACFLVFFFFVFASPSFAQLVINEFSAMTSDDDWVEICNNSGESLNLSEYTLIDNGGNQKEFSPCLLIPNGVFSVDWYNKLNNDGDKILLKRGDSVIDCVAYKKGPECDGSGVDLPNLSADEYEVRQPEGSGNWTKITNHSKADNTQCNTVTPTPSSSPTPTPPSATATYKINEVKDDNDNTLSNVKIYVDGEYVHHYTPETLTFCDGCTCDDYVDCSFGNHTIKLEKSGYQDWNRTTTITTGDYFEVNPVMSLSSSTLTPTPTSKPASPTPKSTPSVKKENTQQSYQTDTPKYDWEQNENPTPEPSVINLVLGEETKKSSKRPPFAILFILASLLFFTVAFYPQIKPKIQDFIEERFQRPI